MFRSSGARIALILLLCPVSAIAQSDGRTQAIIGAFEAWMADHNYTSGSIAVAYGSKLLETVGIGRSADEPVTLASLSKAVTAACLTRFEQQGAFDLDTQVGALLPNASDTGASTRPIGAFLAQAAGLSGDATQGNPLHLAEDRSVQHAPIASKALESEVGPAGTFLYSNENYAVFGAVIDAVAQNGYAADCKELVFDPLGLTSARLDPVWGPHGAWGGWSMSVGDYALFAAEWFGSDRNFGADPHRWPRADVGRGAEYVMGAFYRNVESRDYFWHSGLLCWGDEGAGAYFASYNKTWLVVASVDECVTGDAFRDLDTVLFKAANP